MLMCKNVGVLKKSKASVIYIYIYIYKILIYTLSQLLSHLI